jgi:Ribbon-helix-helix protein, copG family
MMSADPDAALDRAARAEGISKAAVVRRLVAERLSPLPPLEDDALWGFVGKSRGRRDDSTSVDDVVYPR